MLKTAMLLQCATPPKPETCTVAGNPKKIDLLFKPAFYFIAQVVVFVLLFFANEVAVGL